MGRSLWSIKANLKTVQCHCVNKGYKMSIMNWNLLREDVQLGELLGSGSFGDVYAASVKDVGPAAIKKISRAKLAEYCLQFGMEPEDLVNAELECGQLLGNEPGFVGASGLFQDEQSFYLVMPLVTPSKTWDEVKDPFEAILLLVSLLNTLARCHARGVMHRDVRMDNIMLVRLQDPHRTLGRTGICDIDVPVLADFSLATRAEKSDYIFWNFEKKYMAPEALDAEDYGHGVDLFAVGAIGQQLSDRFNACPFMGELYAPFCEVLLSSDPEKRLLWRGFLRSKVVDAADLYRSS
eukprot:GILK01022800.1.p1 GENE.GILK01022800.1~~GILK01022800.1.p1  ORF type:complete len:294 (-),score=34.28 GILK01022800.1:14-895(-)